jgi:dCMP deaminase
MEQSSRRIDWDEYFMAIAAEVMTRATCDIGPSGAVIVRERRILCTGYTGSVRGMAHCEDVGHPQGATSCGNVLTGEMNAILQAAYKGVNIDGATIYTTAAPDWYSFQHIANSGIVTICHAQEITDDLVLRFSPEAGIDLIYVPYDINS